METLEHPDSIYLSAAQGWLALGNPAEAAAELDHITCSNREHPEVLEVRWQLAVGRKSWEEALLVADLLCERIPESLLGLIHRSYCLHELKRTEEAWESLLPLVERFPEEWLVRYNLACYACQMGQIDEAKRWLAKARELAGSAEIDRIAAADPDLKPLFPPPPAQA